MRSRPLAGTDLHVSEIGLSLAAALVQPRMARDESALAELVHRALDGGVTLFDTSDAEGAGYAEELLGRLLRGRRLEVVLLTKAGYDIAGTTNLMSLVGLSEAEQRRNKALLAEGLVVPPGRSGAPEDDPEVSRDAAGRVRPRDYRPDSLRKACEASLRRLRTDVIDLWMLQAPPQRAIEHDEVRALFEPLVREGKIRHAGVTVYVEPDADATARAALDWGGCPVLRAPLHFGRAATGLALTARAAATGKGFIAAPIPMTWPQPLRDRLRFLERDRPLAQSGLLWSLGRPGVAAAVPRIAGRADLEAALAALNLTPFSNVEETRLAGALEVDSPGPPG